MTEQYLQSMIDGLDEKAKLLDELTLLTQKQQSVVDSEEPNWDEFDKTVDDKAELIDRLMKLDDGFEAIFDRIKNEVKADKDKYKDYIKKLQAGITVVTEKSTGLMALEERTRQKVTVKLTDQRQKIKQSRVSSKAVTNYYQNMNKINYVDPQLMDQKK